MARKGASHVSRRPCGFSFDSIKGFYHLRGRLIAAAVEHAGRIFGVKGTTAPIGRCGIPFRPI